MYGDKRRGRLLLPDAVQRELPHAGPAGERQRRGHHRRPVPLPGAPARPARPSRRAPRSWRRLDHAAGTPRAEMLAERGVAAEVWSAPRTSCCATRRSRPSAGTGSTRTRHRACRASRSCSEPAAQGPVVAVSDYMKPGRTCRALGARAAVAALGTDGFGRSDTREALRRFFEIDAAHIAQAVVAGLARCGRMDAAAARQARRAWPSTRRRRTGRPADAPLPDGGLGRPASRRLHRRAAGAARESTGTVLAHSITGRFPSPLPLGAYLAGAAVAVALSSASSSRASRSPFARASTGRAGYRRLRAFLRVIGLIGLVAVLLETVLVAEPGDADVGSLFLWVYGWVGVAVLWSSWDRSGRGWTVRLPGARRGLAGAPVRVRRPAPGDLPGAPRPLAGPGRLRLLRLAGAGGHQRRRRPLPGSSLAGYTLVTLAGMLVYGRATWRAQAETFSVWFELLGLSRRWPWTGHRGGQAPHPRLRGRLSAPCGPPRRWRSWPWPWRAHLRRPVPDEHLVRRVRRRKRREHDGAARDLRDGHRGRGPAGQPRRRTGSHRSRPGAHRRGLHPGPLPDLPAHRRTAHHPRVRRSAEPGQPLPRPRGLGAERSMAAAAPGVGRHARVGRRRSYGRRGRGACVGRRGGPSGRARRHAWTTAALRALRRREVPLACLMVGLTVLTLWSLGQVVLRPA